MKKHFSDSFLDELKKDTPIIAQRLLKSAPDGGFICPFCGNGSGHDGTGVSAKQPGLHCFKCGHSFNIFQAVQQEFNIDFVDAVIKCADSVNFPLSFDNDRKPFRKPAMNAHYSLEQKHLLHQHHLHDILDDSVVESFSSSGPLDDYLSSISPVDLSLISWSKSDQLEHPIFNKFAFEDDSKTCIARYRSMLRYLQKRGFCADYASIFDNFNVRFDWKKNSLVIPHNHQYASFRSIPVGSNDHSRYKNNLKNVPTYVFNANALKQDGGVVFVTEGAIDALSILCAINESDFNSDNISAIATAGAGQKTNWQLMFNILRKNPNPPRLVILFDDDPAGNRAADTLLFQLRYLGFTSIRGLISNDDANSLLAKDKSRLKQILAELIHNVSFIDPFSPVSPDNHVEVANFENPLEVIPSHVTNRTIERLKRNLDIYQKLIPPSITDDDIEDFLDSDMTNLDCRDFFSKFIPDYRYNVDTQSWFHFNGSTWVMLNDDSQVREEWSPIIQFISTKIQLEYETKSFESDHGITLHPVTRIKHLKRCIRKLNLLQEMKPIKNMVAATLQKSSNRISEKDFNSDLFLLNLKNGKMNLLRKEFSQTLRDDFCTMSANVSLDLDQADLFSFNGKVWNGKEYIARNPLPSPKPCQQWEMFLQSALPDKRTRVFLQKFMGYCLTGLTSEQVFVFLHGPGGSGKSTFVETMKNILGDYSTSFPIEYLMQNSKPITGDEPSPILFNMRHCRLAIATETQRNSQLNIAKIKQFTGEDSLIARALKKNPIEFKPKFKLLISGNHPPKVDVKDSGLKRRLRIIPFNVVPKKANTKLREIFAEDKNKSAIFAWMMKGLEMYLDDKAVGRNPFDLSEIPVEVEESTKNFYLESNNVSDFLAETGANIDDSFKVKQMTVWNAYQKWCDKMRERCVDRKDFESLILDCFNSNDKINVRAGYDEDLSAWCYYGFKLYRS